MSDSIDIVVVNLSHDFTGYSISSKVEYNYFGNG
jgi:hypothetical protein